MVRTYRGRHASKVTEEEEDEEYLKEEDAVAAGGTRLLIQPSCERLLDDSIVSFISLASLYSGDVKITVCCTVEGSVILMQNATECFSCFIILTVHAELISICYYILTQFICLFVSIEIWSIWMVCGVLTS